MDTKKCFDQIDKAALVDKIESLPEYKILKIAADEIVNKAIDKFALMKIRPDTIYEVMELQIIIRKYRHKTLAGLFGELNTMKQMGESAFNELKEDQALEEGLVK